MFISFLPLHTADIALNDFDGVLIIVNHFFFFGYVMVQGYSNVKCDLFLHAGSLL